VPILRPSVLPAAKESGCTEAVTAVGVEQPRRSCPERRYEADVAPLRAIAFVSDPPDGLRALRRHGSRLDRSRSALFRTIGFAQNTPSEAERSARSFARYR
jgi:hypothetical protein